MKVYATHKASTHTQPALSFGLHRFSRHLSDCFIVLLSSLERFAVEPGVLPFRPTMNLLSRSVRSFLLVLLVCSLAHGRSSKRLFLCLRGYPCDFTFLGLISVCIINQVLTMRSPCRDSPLVLLHTLAVLAIFVPLLPRCVHSCCRGRRG